MPTAKDPDVPVTSKLVLPLSDGAAAPDGCAGTEVNAPRLSADDTPANVSCADAALLSLPPRRATRCTLTLTVDAIAEAPLRTDVTVRVNSCDAASLAFSACCALSTLLATAKRSCVRPSVPEYVGELETVAEKLPEM